MHTKPWTNFGKRIPLTFGFALLIGILAVLSQMGTSKPLLVLLAVVLSLPFGIVSLIGFYILTGLFNWAAAGFSTSSHGSGSGGCDALGHCTSSATQTGVGTHGFYFDFCIAILFTGMAIVNSLFLQAIVARRRKS